MLAADFDEARGLELVEGVGRGLAVDAEAVGDVLMREAVDGVALRLSDEQGGDARGYAFEDRLFELPLGVEDASAEGFEYAPRDLGLRDEKAVEHSAVHRHDDGILYDLREGVVHALTDAGQLAEKTVREKLRDDELSPLGRHSVNLHRARAQ